MLEYVIEGHDGAAKTPIAKRVKDKIKLKGYSCEVYSPFHIANSMISEEDIYVYWNTEKARKAVELLQEIIESIKTLNIHNDVIIYDRHWLTVLGEIDDNSILRKLWNDFPSTFFVEAPVEKTLDCKRFSYNTLWTKSVEHVEYYYHKLNKLAKKYKEHIIAKYKVETRIQSLDPIVDTITKHIQKDLEMENIKAKFLKKLKKLDKLNLPKKSYAITGSGPLAIRNIRNADDIDILVKKDLWEILIKKYTPYDKKHIRIGNIEIWGDFINLTPIMDKVINNAEIIKGYPFVNLEYTLSWKKFLNREKDLKDIKLLENFVK